MNHDDIATTAHFAAPITSAAPSPWATPAASATAVRHAAVPAPSATRRLLPSRGPRPGASLLATLLLSSMVLAGCSGAFDTRPEPVMSYAETGFKGDPAGEDTALWPDLNGTTITILDNGAFSYGCPPAAERFELLTNVKVKCENGGDTGNAVAKLKADGGSGTYDILYGADNTLLYTAQPYFVPYTPVNGARVPSSALFWGQTGAKPWPATPVDQGYIAINWDARAAPPAGHSNDGYALDGSITNLYKVRDNANQFVTQCPSLSTPGLGFMLITISRFGESDGPGGAAYDWHDYWTDLFANGVTVTKDWTDAYENHFSAGYGASYGAADKAIVTSYTESPAYEVFAGTFPAGSQANVLLEPRSTFHQIQTMGIVKGTKHLTAAQAFLEYALTDHFQGLAAPDDAVYPIVPSVDASSIYGNLDPSPGSFKTANDDLPYARVEANLDRWYAEWTALAPANVQGVCASVAT
jgi:thiamine transport system substrate-binding protein